MTKAGLQEHPVRRGASGGALRISGLTRQADPQAGRGFLQHHPTGRRGGAASARAGGWG